MPLCEHGSTSFAAFSKKSKHDVKRGIVDIEKEYKEIYSPNIEGTEEKELSHDPNFLQTITLRDVELADDPMLWPLLRFELTD